MSGEVEGTTPWATLYPDTYSYQGRYSEAVNAIDGQTNRGESGTDAVLNCASTKHSGEWRRLQYLQIDLQRPYTIAAIRLHLQEGRQRWQNGLVVSVSNSTIQPSQTSVGTHCGSPYRPAIFRQSTLFPCWSRGRYVYAVLRYTSFPLQVCEIQIFKGLSIAITRVWWRIIS